MGRGRWRCHASSLGSAAAAIRGAVREAGARAAARMKRRVFVVGVGMTKVRRCPPAIGPGPGTAPHRGAWLGGGSPRSVSEGSSEPVPLAPFKAEQLLQGLS